MTRTEAHRASCALCEDYQDGVHARCATGLQAAALDLASTQPLTLPYPPSLNRLYRTVRGRPILSREARQYRATVQGILAGMAYRASTSPVALSVVLFRPRRAGDADNALKALLDALNGLLWVDDSQIEELHLWRRNDKARPRVELVVREQ